MQVCLAKIVIPYVHTAMLLCVCCFHTRFSPRADIANAFLKVWAWTCVSSCCSQQVAVLWLGE